MSKEIVEEILKAEFGTIALSAFESWPEKEMMLMLPDEYARLVDKPIKIDALNPYYYSAPVPPSATEVILVQVSPTGALSGVYESYGPLNPAGYIPEMKMIWVEPEE